MSTLEHAIAIAAEGHAGQTDKAGEPYILHVLRVMLGVPRGDAQIVAALHDVVEDCPGWTFERLRSDGFSETVLTALDGVTHREGESYDDFVRRAMANPLSRQVKLSDLRDNCDMTRLAAPTDRDHARIDKYRRAIAMIEAAPGP
jgi:(p)ppGpp synthase/HD superfamily hydrolase